MFNVWDRKSPRHKWQPVVSTNHKHHYHVVLINQIRRVRRFEDWPLGQVGTTRGQPEQDDRGIKPLPASASVKIVFSKGGKDG